MSAPGCHLRPAGRVCAGLALALALWLLAPFGGVRPAGAAEAPAPALALAGDSPAAEALLTQPIGPDPAAAWHWAPLLAAVSGQARGAAAADAAALRRAVLALALARAAGEPVPSDATVGSVLARGRALLPISADTAARQRWTRTLQRQLVPVWPDGPLPLPDELDLVAGRTTEVAPGLWTSTLANGAQRSATWAVRLQHVGSSPLAPGDLVLRLARGARIEPVDFDCTLPRGARRGVLRPGQALDLMCRSTRPQAADPGAWGDALERLRQRDAGAITIDSTDLADTAAAERMMATLAEAAPSPVAAFAGRFADCASRGRCAPAATPSTRAATKTAAPPARTPGSPAREQALLVVKLLLGFAVYMLVARVLGERRASGLLTTGLVIASVAVGSRQGTVSLYALPSFSSGWILIPVLLAGSLLVVAVCHGAYKAYAWLFFRARD